MKGLHNKNGLSRGGGVPQNVGLTLPYNQKRTASAVRGRGTYNTGYFLIDFLEAASDDAHLTPV